MNDKPKDAGQWFVLGVLCHLVLLVVLFGAKALVPESWRGYVVIEGRRGYDHFWSLPPPSGDGGSRPRRIATGFGRAYFPRCEFTSHMAELGSAARVWSGLFGSCCVGYFLFVLAMNAAHIEETMRWRIG